MMALGDTPTLQTERLILRAPAQSDAGAYAAFFTDAEASAFYGGPLLAHRAYGKLCQDIGHWLLKGFGIWAITPAGSDRMVGTAGYAWPDGWPRRELTWWLLPSVRGQGYATEASRAVIAWGYDVMGWDRVETHMKDANVAAQRLVERLGGTRIDRLDFPDGEARNIWELPRPGLEGAA